ncbi:uncharacterized protein LOC135071184 [Ostrinia nubilalis]|uniref:uncharacterized protein LOC135071184 n=1 Tax=Ostrinia nubilalis TaxID=29057 RepID=UPI003082292F
MSSPRKKKIKLLDSPNANKHKRDCENTEESLFSKRQKVEKVPGEDLQAKKRRNFITACELVSYKSYYDHNLRFQLIHVPPCANITTCKHHDHKNSSSSKAMPSYAEESFRIEMKTNMWREALEVCRLCITPDQYLSANILKDIVEIMLNAHNDEHTDYTIEYLLDKCQQVFELNFSYHPPCLVKSLRKCYNDFLTSPMDLKDKSFTNRTEFGCSKGIFKYCLNRLEHELSMDSKDEPLVDKCENIPEDMKQSVKGLHWQKEKFEIYELLHRTERIKRLIAVLDTIIELLQYDLTIWHTRYTNNLGSHIMRSHKPLMAYLLWSNNVLFTGAVNNNCRQIMRLFVYMIHLQYPEEHIKVITIWLNTMVQTFYICENNSNSDYPNTGKYCTAFANEFYKIIAEMPHESVIRILERIKPNYMKYLIGTLHIKRILPTQEDDPLKIFTDFVKNLQWKKYPESTSQINIPRTTNFKNTNLMKHLLRRCNKLNSKGNIVDEETETYKRFDPLSLPKDHKISLNHVIHTLYITLEAYLEAYSVQKVQETLGELNLNLESNENSIEQKILPDFCSYSVTEHFIKKYRSIYQSLRELVLILNEMKVSGSLPSIFKVFENIDLLG